MIGPLVVNELRASIGPISSKCYHDANVTMAHKYLEKNKHNPFRPVHLGNLY